MFIILCRYLGLQSQATRVPILQYDATTYGRDNTRQTIVEMLSFNLIQNYPSERWGNFSSQKEGSATGLLAAKL